MTRFHDLLATEIRDAARRAHAHELAGAHDLADWWRGRGQDLSSYLDGVRLRQTVPSPGQSPIRRRPAA
ncbi:hypothetical protein EKO23_23265 [Nocardioides guangzhouensis]|uniref:Uncharacterized protein n=1 Tax=Nocardioides guangzhouensis TaxID=2497878 RepID=A0A4Q4Z404_9ACTN|nr:hypothetical protein [Nocardioides guangzhouensis]RYP81604.1 hypothetical protein EKO23_23265 [Nocardioides guangzhouensis]